MHFGYANFLQFSLSNNISMDQEAHGPNSKSPMLDKFNSNNVTKDE